MPSWSFLKDGAGILPASNMADPLRSSALEAVDLLVRESVQNSLDERRHDVERPVRIRFERRVVFGDDKKRIVDNLDLYELAERRRYFRSSHNWYSKGEEVLDEIENFDVGLPILVISDFYTNGLGGRWNRRGSTDDRFFNLVLSIGASLKWDDEQEDDHSMHALGSYGYGKMAFAINSDIRTIVYYSTFLPDDSTRNVSCRAMASAFLPPHEHSADTYAGQAYFGAESNEPQNPIMPLSDAEAHAWAEKLGLPARPDAETGATVAILASRTEIRDIVASCEKWWWPRRWDPDPDRRVEFEFIDDGNRMPDWDPLSRPQLASFIDCYKLLNAPGGAGEKRHCSDLTVSPRGLGKRTSGRLALQTTPKRSDEIADLTNNIALVRNGLVIGYDGNFAYNDENRPSVVGVFSPDPKPDTMQAFVFSEPPPHDKWEENSDRLRGKYGWGKDFIRLTKQRIKSATRDFQTRQMDEPDVEKTNAAEFLRKSLSRLFQPRGPRQPPPSRRRAFTIATTRSGRRRNGAHHEDFAVFRIGLSDHVDVQSVVADVRFSCKALADVDGSPRDYVPCEVENSGRIRRGGANATLTIELRQGETVDAEARARVHPQWKTIWDIEIVRKEG